MKKAPQPKRRKKSSHLSEHKPARRRRHVKKSLLSDLTDPTIAKQNAKGVLMATGGGLLSTYANKLLPTKWGTGAKIVSGLVAGFLLNNFVNPSLGGGFTGGMIALSFPNGLAEDNTQFADPDSLNEQPLYLDEEGTPMILEEDGEGNSYFREMTMEEAQILNEA